MSLEQTMSLNTNSKLKLALFSTISEEWVYLHSNKIEIVNSINNADYIIYESNGDPINIIENIKQKFTKHKLVFILSGDQNAHIDNECIWFTNAVKPEGIASRQTQIFCTNPAIFKFYENNKLNLLTLSQIDRNIDIYFKGTIWDGMRTDMYDTFVNKPNCNIIKNNQYWKWRLNSPITPSQELLEATAFQSYKDIMKSKLCLCPKGNGNSSMRIIETIVCGAIPILINDFSEPFDRAWGYNVNEFCLSFDSKIHSWDMIYNECIKLINDYVRLDNMQKNGRDYFNNIIYSDSNLTGFKMYNNIDTVCYGFSNIIVDKLYEIHYKEQTIN